MGMLPLLAIAAVLCMTPPLPTHMPPAQRVLFPFDPVILLGSGEKMEGVATREADYGGFHYRFATEASQRAFAAMPARFAIACGGGCARMGPLSDAGDVQRFEVANDRLYIFASDACRASFLKEPAAFLEVADDPFPTDQRGIELATIARRWLRADAACPKEIVVLATREEKSADLANDLANDVVNNVVNKVVHKVVHKVRDEMRLAPNLTFTLLNAWNDDAWWTTACFSPADDKATPMNFKRSTAQGEQPLDESQIEAFRRVAMLEPIFLSRLLLQSDVKLAGGGTENWKVGEKVLTGEILKMHWKGVTVEWLLKPATGQPVAQRAMKRSRDARFALVTESLAEWNDTAGVRVPMVRTDGVTMRKFDAVESDCKPEATDAVTGAPQ